MGGRAFGEAGGGGMFSIYIAPALGACSHVHGSHGGRWEQSHSTSYGAYSKRWEAVSGNPGNRNPAAARCCVGESGDFHLRE